MYSGTGVTVVKIPCRSSYLAPHIRHTRLSFNPFIENRQNTFAKYANLETVPNDTCSEVPPGAPLSTAELNTVILAPFSVSA